MLGAGIIVGGSKVGDFKAVAWPVVDTPGAALEPEPGWLLCNGALVAQATYARLFAELGSSYNQIGDPQGYFRLPPASDRFLLATGNMATRPRGTRAGALGHQHEAPHTHSQAHTHPLGGHTHGTWGHAHGATSDGDAFPVTADLWDVVGTQRDVAASGHTHGFNTGGPSIDTTSGPTVDSGGASVGQSGEARRSSDFLAEPKTDAQDPPHQVAGGLLVRFA